MLHGKRKKKLTESGCKLGQAKAILEMMVADGVVTRDNLTVYTARLDEEAKGLMERLKLLGYSVGETVRSAAQTASERVVAESVDNTRKSRRKAKTRATPSAEVSATRQLQGRYMGLTRKIGDKALVQERFGRGAIQEHGKENVVRMMEEYLSTQVDNRETPIPTRRRRSTAAPTKRSPRKVTGKSAATAKSRKRRQRR